jgi:hypothetical protein
MTAYLLPSLFCRIAGQEYSSDTPVQNVVDPPIQTILIAVCILQIGSGPPGADLSCFNGFIFPTAVKINSHVFLQGNRQIRMLLKQLCPKPGIAWSNKNRPFLILKNDWVANSSKRIKETKNKQIDLNVFYHIILIVNIFKITFERNFFHTRYFML